MGMPGMGEMILIFLVVLLVFGAKRIPEIARGVGQGIREFKSATNEITSEITSGDKKTSRPQPPRQGTPTPRPQETASQPATEEPLEPQSSDNPGSAEKAHS